MMPPTQSCWQYPARPLPPRIVVLVIILVFIATMAALGYAPAIALGVVLAALTAVGSPGTALAVPGR
jgi:hypothetical protein